MADNNLLETYNPLYDVHLRQYFASPHMQKHLRGLGLLDSNGVPVAAEGDNNVESQLYARHQVMMDMMLRNRERVLMQLADLQKKLDAAEKVEVYRRVRSGITNAEEFRRHHLTTRSFSRPSRGRIRDNNQEHQRRNSYDESELVKRIENDLDATQNEYNQKKSLYSRLAANAYKYQYLHRLDDRTLLNYKETLRRQLQKLELFREISFGPHSVAKHQPSLQNSWFFRRRSLPILNNERSTVITQRPIHTLQLPARNSKSATRQRAGKSCSPHRANRLPPASSSSTQTSVQTRKSKTKQTKQAKQAKQASRKLPPLPQHAKSKATSSGYSVGTQKLPLTVVVKSSKKQEKKTETRSSPGTSIGKLPKIIAGGALIGDVAPVLVVSDSEPHPEMSDTDYSRPETDSDALPSDAEQSFGASPQPYSDVEPEQHKEFVEEIHQEPDATPKDDRVFEYNQSHEEPIVEDPIHKQHTSTIEEYDRHVRSVESQQPTEDDYAQHEEQNYAEPNQHETPFDSAVYSRDSNPLHDEQRSEETPRSFNELQHHKSEEEEEIKSEGTHQEEYSAFSPHSMYEEVLPDRHLGGRNEITIEPEIVEPMSHIETLAASHEEVENTHPEEDIGHIEETIQERRERHESPDSQIHQSGHEEDEFPEHSESPIQQQHEENEDVDPIQHGEEESPYHKEVQQDEAVSSVEELKHIDNYTDQSESGPYHQTEDLSDLKPAETKPEEKEFQNNFSLSNDTFIPVMEGESLRDDDSEDDRSIPEPHSNDSLMAADGLPIESSQPFDNYAQMVASENDSIYQEDESDHESVHRVSTIHNDGNEAPNHSSPPTSANNAFLVAQPSIEVTPASDYSGSRENVDRLEETATPEISNTPSSNSDYNDDSGHPTEHDGLHSEENEHNVTSSLTGTFGEHHDEFKRGDVHEEEEKTHQEHYHLPESPDPNAHNIVIPEQHEESGLTVPDEEELVPRDHLPGDEHVEPIHDDHEHSSNHESQHTASDTEHSFKEGDNNFVVDHSQDADVEQRHLENDNGNRSSPIETSYHHAYPTSNGHVAHNGHEHNGDYHSDEEEVFNDDLNGNGGDHQRGSNGYHNEDEIQSLVRKSVEEESDSEKEETGSVIIRESPNKAHHTLEHHVD